MWTAAGAHLNYSLRVLAGFFDEPALEDALGAAKDDVPLVKENH